MSLSHTHSPSLPLILSFFLPSACPCSVVVAQCNRRKNAKSNHASRLSFRWHSVDTYSYIIYNRSLLFSYITYDRCCCVGFRPPPRALCTHLTRRYCLVCHARKNSCMCIHMPQPFCVCLMSISAV